MEREIIVRNDKQLEEAFRLIVKKSVDFPVKYYWRPASGYLGYDAEEIDECGDVFYTSCIDSPMALPQRGEKSDEEFLAALNSWFDAVVEPEVETITSPLVVTFWDNKKDILPSETRKIYHGIVNA